jgi:hypothetical protein
MTLKMCGAHARYRRVRGVSCRGLSEGQLGIGCSMLRVSPLGSFANSAIESTARSVTNVLS